MSAQTLTPENLWKLHRVYGEQVSPDGMSVIYIQKSYNLSENKGTAQLFKVMINAIVPQELSNLKTNVVEARWRPDGKKIGYLSAESGTVQLWEMNPDGKEAKQVTHIEGGIANFQYSPDMKHISYSQDVKIETSLADKYPDLPHATGKAYDDLMVRHWTQWHDYQYQHLFIADYGSNVKNGTDIMKGEPFDSPMMPFGGAEQVAWAPDGNSLVYVCKKKKGKDYALSTNSELWQYDLASAKTTNLTEGQLGYDNEPVFSKDGNWLAWVGMKRDGFESDKNVVWVRNMSSGKKFPLTENLDQSFSNLCWNDNGDAIYAISGVQATQQIFKLSLVANAETVTLEKIVQLSVGEHNVNSLAWTGKKLIGSLSSMSQPAELHVWDSLSTQNKSLPVTHANDEMIANMKMGKVEKRLIKTTDGKDMLTWVIYPPDFNPAKKYPTLLYCQGGPQSAVSQFFSYRWNFQLMAANGYIVVAPNRRGLPSFGQEWNDQISQDWGGQAMKDYLSAIDEVAKEPYVDKENLGAVGASYGGYSVYYLAGIHEGRFKCFVSHCGLFNLESWYGSTEELFFANWDIGGPYWEPTMKDAYAKNSPHRLVDKWDTPILVIHNDLDFRVPINQGLEAFTAAQLRGVPSKLLFYPDEGHWVLKPQNGVMWHREFYSWLDTYLK
ncbi:MAG: S9 family peptidase [Flavobacteriales bacterium]